MRRDGFATKLFGRRTHAPDIAAKSLGQRQAAERAAINPPTQGAAAEIIRRARACMSKALAAEGLASRMLLQVHDELVFEALEVEAQTLCALARRVMQGAAEPAVALSVPLTVDGRFAQLGRGAPRRRASRALDIGLAQVEPEGR